MYTVCVCALQQLGLYVVYRRKVPPGTQRMMMVLWLPLLGISRIVLWGAPSTKHVYSWLNNVKCPLFVLKYPRLFMSQDVPGPTCTWWKAGWYLGM